VTTAALRQQPTPERFFNAYERIFSIPGPVFRGVCRHRHRVFAYAAAT
jgi:hypothetical protein